MSILGTVASSYFEILAGPPTYTYINKYTTSTGDTSVTFNSVPQTYSDLLIRMSVRDNANAAVHNIALKFNNNSSSYNGTFFYSEGSTAGAGATGRNDFAQGSYAMANTSRADSFSIIDAYVFDYTNSSRYKCITYDNALANNSLTSGGMNYWHSIWSNNAAITTVTITEIDGAAFIANSTFYLYGISNS